MDHFPGKLGITILPTIIIFARTAVPKDRLIGVHLFVDVFLVVVTGVLALYTKQAQDSSRSSTRMHLTMYCYSLFKYVEVIVGLWMLGKTLWMLDLIVIFQLYNSVEGNPGYSTSSTG